ncbi:hypothetical protein RFI_37054, partial [Reticulomyxa filosa]
EKLLTDDHKTLHELDLTHGSLIYLGPMKQQISYKKIRADRQKNLERIFSLDNNCKPFAQMSRSLSLPHGPLSDLLKIHSSKQHEQQFLSPFLTKNVVDASPSNDTNTISLHKMRGISKSETSLDISKRQRQKDKQKQKSKDKDKDKDKDKEKKERKKEKEREKEKEKEKEREREKEEKEKENKIKMRKKKNKKLKIKIFTIKIKIK